ncbi:MAG: hypothetical protein V4579_00725 [Pseudomonadota bacterium]
MTSPLALPAIPECQPVLDWLRRANVWGCALALICAGQALPLPL